MGFKLNRNTTPEGVSFTADRRLYGTRDGRVVEEGDPDALYLLAGKGGQIDAKTADRLKLTEKGQDWAAPGPVPSEMGKPEEAPARGADIEREKGIGVGPAVQTVRKMSGGPGRPLGSGREK